jgi:repressor LexA
MEPLTGNEALLFNHIRDFIQHRGYPPTVRELVSLTGKKSIAGVQNPLAALERKGYLKKTPNRSRGIDLIGAPRSVHIPIVGVVPAGIPLLAEENIEGYFSLNANLAPQNSFLLKVQGDSMIGDHIQDEDYVLVQSLPDAQNGDIVVAALNGEVTVKRFQRKRGGIYLVPSNPDLKEIRVHEGDELRMIGKVIAVFRFLGPNTWSE